MAEQVLEQLAAFPQVAFAFVPAQEREIVVRETVRAEGDAGLAHLEHLVPVQRAEWLRRRVIDPIDRRTPRRQRPGDQEHRRGETVLAEDWHRMRVQRVEAVIEGERGDTARQAHGAVHAVDNLAKADDAPVPADPGALPSEGVRRNRERRAPGRVDGVITEDGHESALRDPYGHAPAGSASLASNRCSAPISTRHWPS